MPRFFWALKAPLKREKTTTVAPRVVQSPSVHAIVVARRTGLAVYNKRVTTFPTPSPNSLPRERGSNYYDLRLIGE